MARSSPATPRALSADTLIAPATTEDSNAVRPTSAELTELASTLIVPVAGVQPRDLYASDPTDRFVLMYAHLDRYAAGLTDGMPLRRGDTIGYVGTTGNAPPNVPHLHFAIARTTNVARWWTGVPVDPRPLLQR